MERYRIIYLWKILEGLTPNCGIETTHSDRRGREVKIPQVKGIRGKIQTLREASFQIHGPRLFNNLQTSVRTMTNVTVEEFKCSLDKFLCMQHSDSKSFKFHKDLVNKTKITNPPLKFHDFSS